MAEVGANISLKKEEFKDLDKEIQKEIDNFMNEVADFIFAESQQNIVKNNSFGVTGELFGNVTLKKHQKFKKSVIYEAPYCLIGGKQKVFIEGGCREASRINCPVLTKDGTYHPAKSFRTGRFSMKPIGIKLRCEKGRGNLLVTCDHLILSSQEGIPVWMRADSLRVGDIVYHKRKLSPFKGSGTLVDKVCLNCNKNFKVKKHQTRFSKCAYCSQECYHTHTDHARAKGKRWKLTLEQREKSSGKNNPAWQGGISKLPYGPEWCRALKYKVRKRDGFVCHICKKPEENISHHVHHINGNKFDNSMKNLITLCPSCHGKQQWRDCELVYVNMGVFEEVKIVKAERFYASSHKGADKKRVLWDVSVQGENSFYVGGMIIHNSSFVEYGTLPHNLPPGVLDEWAKRKFGLSQEEAKRVAFLVARKIAREGIKEKPFLRPAMHKSEVYFRG